MARPKKPKNDPFDELEVVGQEQPGPAFKRGHIIQVVPADRETRHPFMANIMIVHAMDEDKLICYQPGRDGFPQRRLVNTVDALVVGLAKLKYPEDKELPAGEKPVYNDPLDKI